MEMHKNFEEALFMEVAEVKGTANIDHLASFKGANVVWFCDVKEYPDGNPVDEFAYDESDQTKLIPV